MENTMGREDDIANILALLMKGDCWLSADACAAYLGGIKRRTFLETIACRPDFPNGLPVGNRKAWKKSEVEEWAQNTRRANAVGRA
jgi:predicted DNA-binding transcriptional regulator AlpA